MRIRPRAALAALAASSVLLSGCVGLPQSGEVHVVEGPTGNAGIVGLTARPPAEGAEPEKIVSGFLSACQSGIGDDFAVARQYLMPEAAQGWNPASQVRIYPDTQSVSISRTATGAVHASVGSAGSLSHQGIYTAASGSAMVSTDFSLARNADGEWRIVVLEDGVLLPEQAFTDSYAETPLYFLSADSRSLVADLRFFPKRTLATEATRALLAGPAEWLAPGVRTAAPADAALASGGIEVEAGKATVHLSRAILAAQDDELAKLLSQLSATLTAASNIDTVELAAEDSPLDIKAQGDIAPYPYGSYPLTAIVDAVPATIRDQRATALMDEETLDGKRLSSIASAYESVTDSLAAVAEDGRQLLGLKVRDGAVSVLAEGTRLLAPSYDAFGWIWSGEEANEGKLLAIFHDGSEIREIDAPWLEGVSVRQLAVSREGARLAAIVEEEGAAKLLCAAISRDTQDVPKALGDPVVAAQGFSTMASAAWDSQTQLAVLGTLAGSSEVAIYTVQVGGLTQKVVSAREGTVALTAGRGQQSITVLTGGGEAYVLNGGAWNRLIDGATALAFPG